MTYQIKSNKQLKAASMGLCKSVKGMNNRLQQFLGDFLISYNQNRDSSPLSNLFKVLEQEDGKTKYKMITWIAKVSNYKVAKNDKGNFVLKSTDDKPEFTPNELFNTTHFYDKDESEEKDNTVYKDIDTGLKALDKMWEKAMKTCVNDSEKEQFKAKLRELLAK